MNQVVRVGKPSKAVCIASHMIRHEMWHKSPKLFHIWAYRQLYPQATQKAVARAMGCSIDTIKKNLRKLKRLGQPYGVDLHSSHERSSDETHTTAIDAEMISHKMWHKNPKLFHIWVFIQSKKRVTQKSIAEAMGCSMDVVHKNVAKLKEVGKAHGIELLQIKVLNYDGYEKVTRAQYKVIATNLSPLCPDYLKTEKDYSQWGTYSTKDPVLKFGQQVLVNPLEPQNCSIGRSLYRKMKKLHKIEKLAEIPF